MAVLVGQEAEGTGAGAILGTGPTAFLFTAAQTGEVTELHITLSAAGAGTGVRLGLCAENAVSKKPETTAMLAEGEVTSQEKGSHAVAVTGVHVTAGVNYFLVGLGVGGSAKLKESSEATSWHATVTKTKISEYTEAQWTTEGKLSPVSIWATGNPGPTIPFAAAAATTSASLGLTAATTLSLAAAAASTSAALALEAVVALEPATAAASTSASLALDAIAVLAPATAVASTSTSLALIAVGPATIPFATAAAATSTSLALRAATTIPFAAGLAATSATLALEAAKALAPNTAVSVTSATLALNAARSLEPATAASASSTSLALAATVRLLTSPAVAASAGSLTLIPAAVLGLEPATGTTTATLTLMAVVRVIPVRIDITNRPRARIEIH